MNRVRWLRAEWPVSMPVLAEKMKSQGFNRDSTDGFVVDRVRDTFIEARYIEKLNYQETISDPFGGEQIFDRVVYRTVVFSLFSGYPQLELYDTPRSTKAFVSRMLEMCNFSLPLVSLSVNVIRWIENFQALSDQQVLVNSINVSGLEIEQGVIANLLLKSERDALDALASIAKGRRYSLDKVHMRCSSGKNIIPIVFSSSGAAMIPDDNMRVFLPLIRKSLPEPSIK
jgi:hypothetical protein